eukprot:2149740-Amphidinium_carterae.1
MQHVMPRGFTHIAPEPLMLIPLHLASCLAVWAMSAHLVVRHAELQFIVPVAILLQQAFTLEGEALVRGHSSHTCVVCEN